MNINIYENVFTSISHAVLTAPGEADAISTVIPVLWRGNLNLTEIKEIQGHS